MSQYKLIFNVPGIAGEIAMPVTSKSQAQAMINVLDMARVTNVRVVCGSELLYIPHMITNVLVKPQE